MGESQVLCEMHKNQKENIVVSLSEYQGSTRVDVRIFFEVAAHEFIPTKKGINIALKDWQEFKDLIDRADKAIVKKSD